MDVAILPSSVWAYLTTTYGFVCVGRTVPRSAATSAGGLTSSISGEPIGTRWPRRSCFVVKYRTLRGVRGGRESHHAEYVDPGTRKGTRLLRVVGQQARRPDAKCAQASGRIGERASIGGEPEVLIRLQRVETAILQHVRSQLVGETDPSTLVAGRIHEHPATFGGDRPLCLAELDATIAPERPERVAGQAFRMQTHQDVLAITDGSPAQTEVDGAVPIERPGLPLAEGSGQRQLRDFRGDDRHRGHVSAAFPATSSFQPPPG